jgi:hypothetical protein
MLSRCSAMHGTPGLRLASAANERRAIVPQERFRVQGEALSQAAATRANGVGLAKAPRTSAQEPGFPRGV